MSVALIVIDMVNCYEHEDARHLGELIAEARKREPLVAYVDDNPGDWTAGREELAAAAMDGAAPALVEPLVPPPVLPVVVKARHSMFRNMRAHRPPCQEASDVAVTVEAPE